MDEKKEYIENHRKKINEEIPEPNKTYITDFFRFIENQGRSYSYKLQILRELYNLHKGLNKNFKKVTRKDINLFVESLRKPKEMRRGTRNVIKPYAENSVRCIVAIMKCFFKWLFETEDGYPKCVSHIKTSNPQTNITEEDVLSIEDMKKLGNACMNDRDRALIQVLFESGARIGEFMGMRRKDIKFDGYGALITLKSEKLRDEKSRPVRIKMSVPALERWLRNIPDDPESLVWVDVRTKKPVTYSAIDFALKKMGKRAGLEKKVHAHLFRHSSATYWMSQGMTDAILKKRHGWKQSSRMLDRYSHLSDKQADEATLRVLGYEINGDGEKLDRIVCTRCGTENELTNYCSRCSFPLNDKAAAESLEKQQRYEMIMERASKDPRFGQILKIMEEIMSRPPE